MVTPYDSTLRESISSSLVRNTAPRTVSFDVITTTGTRDQTLRGFDTHISEKIDESCFART
jgi:hypothetical protein